MKRLTLPTASKGFGLIELLCVVTIIALLAVWAVSDYTSIRQRAQLAQTASQLVDAIDYSRQYARHLSTDSILCAGEPIDQCQSTQWNQGFTLFQADYSKTPALLQPVRFFQAEATGLNIAFAPDPGKGIIINKDGFVSDSELSAVVCHQSQDFHFEINVHRAQTKAVEHEVSTTGLEGCKNAL